MVGSATLAKARMELEELYLGIPDESVNLTFQDLADVKKQQSAAAAVTVSPSSSSSLSSSSSDKKQLKKKPSSASTTSTSLGPITELVANNKDVGRSPSPSPPFGSNTMKKLPSLDFNRGLQAASSKNLPHYLTKHDHNRNHHHDYHSDQSPILHMDHLYSNDQEHPIQVHGSPSPHSPEGGEHVHGHPLHVNDAHHHHYHHHTNDSNFVHATLPAYHHMDYSVSRHDHHHHTHHNHSHATMEHSMATYDDISVMSTAFDRGGGRRRPGIPHSNICTICSTYIYIFRTRCLVCGRVYCRQCMNIGMGEMTEGRKCIECLGRRFSQRYIQRAGKMGCCSRYASTVKQAELKWAEKGPRRNAERGHGRSMMMSRSRSPTPMTPARNNNTSSNSNPPSFVVNSPSPYSPYSPVHHPIPF